MVGRLCIQCISHTINKQCISSKRAVGILRANTTIQTTIPTHVIQTLCNILCSLPYACLKLFVSRNISTILARQAVIAFKQQATPFNIHIQKLNWTKYYISLLQLSVDIECRCLNNGKGYFVWHNLVPYSLCWSRKWD